MSGYALVMPPASAPLAYHTLAGSFRSMMGLVGIEIQEISRGATLPIELDAALYAWSPGHESERPRARRHIEIFVDCDLPPSRSVERIYPSEAWRNYMWAKHHGAQLGPEHFGAVIPNWVDPALWPISYEPEAAPSFFLYAGRLWPNKTGILPHLMRALPDEFFYIAGEGDRSYLDAPNARFLGRVDQPHLATLMGLATAVLCPTVYCEPFGLAAVEAELTGALVIASDVGGFHETLSAASSRVSPYALDEWVTALRMARLWANHLRGARRNWQVIKHSPAVIGAKYARFLETPPPQISIDSGARGGIEAVLEPA